MDKKSKTVIAVIFILVFLSVLLTFYRTMVAKDYPIIEASQ